MWPQAAQHDCAGLHSSTTPPPRGKIKMDEGDVSDSDELDMAQGELTTWAEQWARMSMVHLGFSK